MSKDIKDLLECAIGIAVSAHSGQKDKAGLPYILHPLRVMMAVESCEAKIAAVLHDVIEDSSITLSDLATHGFPAFILDAIDCLTHARDECYIDYVARVKINSIASIVKLADLRDNSDIFRLSELNSWDIKRLQKYHKALNFLMEKE